MKIPRMLFSVVLSLATLTPAESQAPHATIAVVSREFRTYPYSDPDPVPRMGNIYPYFRFQGYTATPMMQSWKVVILENEWIRVLVAPEMGGKILGAFEKKSGSPFIYFNNVVKFREIAMRGPWTSGGVEFNFGDLGHAPTTASPVDYRTRTNADGSVSCIVGTMDLASRTEWRVEIRLPADKAFVETRSFWYNPTDLSTSRYHWMNGAVDATNDLEFIYPGTAFIGHDGELGAWPVNPQGRDISKYRNNDFGSYKSYHVLGRNTDFFGVRWASRDLGVLHWSRYADKPGKKLWIWGLSREGEIWRELLTDPALGNDQYVEIQSGLHFNQPTSKSFLTPFKHMSFPPSTTEQFTERWMPFRGLRNVVAADADGVINVEQAEDGVHATYCALARTDEPLTVRAGGRVVGARPMHLQPLETAELPMPGVSASAACSVFVGSRLVYAGGDGKQESLDRPFKASGFDWSSAYGLSVDARERWRQRDYDGAYEYFRRSLDADPFYAPSLVGAAECAIHRLDATAALKYARQALAIDAYDPEANYLYGLVQRERGSFDDARDGFGFAARSAGLRTAAYVQLAEMAFLRGNMPEAGEYTRRALAGDATAMRALHLQAVLSRIAGDSAGAAAVRVTVAGLDPLDHFMDWEVYRMHPIAENLAAFNGAMHGEFPHESCQEIAAEYIRLGLYTEALAVLRVAPQHPMVQLWTAYLLALTGREEEGRALVATTMAGSVDRVFPYRTEDDAVLDWAARVSTSWKVPYLRALLHWSRGRKDLVKAEFTQCGDAPDLPAFYAARAMFTEATSGHLADGVRSVEADLRRALALGRSEWRTHQALTDFLALHGRFEEALRGATDGARRFPANYALQLTLARARALANDLMGAREILDTLAILPFEGARYGREAHRFVYVMSALEALKHGQATDVDALLARAREWPERLGSGKPYDPDERIEDLIAAVACAKRGDMKGAAEFRRRIAVYSQEHATADRAQHLIGILSLRAEGRTTEAAALLQEWKRHATEHAAQTWSWEFLEGRTKQLRALEAAAPKEMDPWSGDADFLLVRNTVRALGLH
jgi:tetratricopeptide (TPR) repeat protein